MAFHSMTASETANALKTDKNSGLSAIEAAKRLLTDGKNEIFEKKRKNILLLFLSQFQDFMIIVLLVSAAISFVISGLGGENDLDPIIILAIVILNAVVGVFQETRAISAIEGLKKLTAPSAFCIRDGKRVRVPSSEIVRGDLLAFSAGDMISADCRIIEATGLNINESSLTGESEPSQKHSDIIPDNALVPDRSNCAFASTLVTSGRGKALVIATGMNTEVGRVASMLNEGKEQTTPLQKRLAAVGKTLAFCAFFCCIIVFLFGLLRHYSPFSMFMTSVSLAVAAIPEGLPAIVTVMLAMGVSSMAKKKAVVRNLPAVETLGSATVICSDKTGTLTVNEMTVTEIIGDKDAVASLMLLCSDSESTSGTESAIIRAFKDSVQSSEFVRISEMPFSSERKKMTVSLRHGDEYMTVEKGAFDVLFPSCTKILENGKEAPLTAEKRAETELTAERTAASGLRVIAVTAKKSGKETLSASNMTFIGMVALSDPLRPEAKSAAAKCKKAGIDVIMITGDHRDTALYIANELGIARGGAITGAELDNMSDAELSHALKTVRVFARVLPGQKVKIVRTLKSMGHIVAMTGDGVNDAPALREADIGCAMGQSGTDVARQASDMVLTDDNFATIVDAVHEGRIIYGNIRKAIHFLLSSNIGEILLMLSGIVAGLGAPLLPIQLLWVNLITDSLPAIALGMDRTDDGIMEHPPEKSGSGFFSGGLLYDILIEGAFIGAISMTAFCSGFFSVGGVGVARTMAFCTLSLSQLVHAFDVRSSKSVFVAKNHNPWLFLSLFTGAALQCSVALVPSLLGVFGTQLLTVRQWITVVLLSLAPLAVSELSKLFCRK